MDLLDRYVVCMHGIGLLYKLLGDSCWYASVLPPSTLVDMAGLVLVHLLWIYGLLDRYDVWL